MSNLNIPEGVDFGPLLGLVGTWTGDKGIDVAPEPDGSEDNPYYETIIFEAVGDVTNAEKQVLAVVSYHQVVRRKSNDEVFHDEVGYWMWDAATGTIMQSLIIPRAVGLLAGGEYAGAFDAASGITLQVAARLNDPDWGIVQSPFMRDNASTVEFRHDITFDANRMSYSETTVLDIYGRTFDHTDDNELVRA